MSLMYRVNITTLVERWFVMLSKIPSWTVGLIGALMVLMSVAIGATMLRKTTHDIAMKSSMVSEYRREIDNKWSNWILAAQRKEAADLYVADELGIPLNANPIRDQFIRDKIAGLLQGAILAMTVASGKQVPDETPSAIQDYMDKLRSGDYSAYRFLLSEINSLEKASQDSIKQLSDNIKLKETEIIDLRNRESMFYMMFVCFNILGLIIVMLKDLPIWKAVNHQR